MQLFQKTTENIKKERKALSVSMQSSCDIIWPYYNCGINPLTTNEYFQLQDVTSVRWGGGLVHLEGQNSITCLHFVVESPQLEL